MPPDYTRAFVARFWSGLRLDGPVPPYRPELGPCWPRAGARQRRYAYVRHAGRLRRAHRVASEIVSGPVPPGLCVLHACDNPPCCRPSHLFRGSQADNVADMDAKRRRGTTRGRPMPPGAVRRGSAHPGAKLDERAAAEIRAAARAGVVTRRALAARYGVTPSAITHVTSGRLWR